MATYLPSSGAISINDINTVFGRGNNLNAYRGTTYYTSSAGPFTFSSGAISMNAFYGTGPTANTPAYDFTISPAVGGVSNWSLTTNGPLNLSGYGEWTITMATTITVSSKMWGGGGGPGGSYGGGYPPTTNIGIGGGGGYAGGTFQLTSGSVYKLRVGQGGFRSRPGTGVPATYLKGGSAGYWSSEGAGYTGLFLTSATQANAILIAGGGGGGSDTSFGNAGAGGGSQGQDCTQYPGQGGGGGTQGAGGPPGSYNGATAGSALTGGSASTQKGANGSLGGGGGGYYGGGGGNVGGGGGGSGYYKSGTVSSPTLTAGSGGTPGNSGDGSRGSSGSGGTGSTAGSDGRSILTLVSRP